MKNNIKIPFFHSLKTQDGKPAFGFLQRKKAVQTLSPAKVFGITLTKRRKIILIAILIAISHFALSSALESQMYLWQKLALLLIITYISTLWILDFDMRLSELFLFPLYPILISAIYLLLFPLFNNVGIPAILVSLSLAIFQYITLLTVNILNISTIRFAPLKRVATNVYHFISLALTILLMSLTFYINMPYLSRVLLVGIMSLVISYPVVWFTANIEQRQQGRMIYLIALLLMQVAWLFQFLPITWHTAALTLGFLQYLLLTLLVVNMQSEVNRRVSIEYLLVGTLVTITLFLSLEWGAFS